MLALKLKLFAIIFIASFKHCESQCDGVPYTFSFSAAEICNVGKICSNVVVDGCVENSTFTSVKILSPLKTLKWGAFKDSDNLKTIKLNGVGLEEIEPKAFLNVPQACWIAMANNSIRTIRSGVFSKTRITSIDLYSNKISAIDDYAFAFMPYLQTLSLTGNLLHEIKENWFTNTTIRYLLLSRNKFRVLRLSTISKLNKLSYLDLTFNEIIRVDSAPNLNLKLQKLFLCGNNLTNLRFASSVTVKVLCVSFNKISHLDEPSLSAVSSANVKEIYIHPNPWHCSCLQEFENMLRLRNVTVVQPESDPFITWTNEFPVCIEGDVKRSTCDGISEAEIKSGQEDYFKALSYDSLTNRNNYAFSDVSKFISICRKYTGSA